jgi:tetratricopeptide (TPR) repeat protein
LADERLEQAHQIYERSVFGGDQDGIPAAMRDLDQLEADLALARGQLLHAKFLDDRVEDESELACFERAVWLSEHLADERGLAESLFWMGTFHQVVRQDHDTALPFLERSRELSTKVGDTLTLSYALRHLCFVARANGQLDLAQDLLMESLRLRRELGFSPGVAANLVGLAYLAAEQGRPADAIPLLDDAANVAASCGASKILSLVDEARAAIPTM